MRSIVRCLACIGLLLLLAPSAFGASGNGLWSWYLIPAAGSIQGKGGSYWHLDMTILNPYDWRSVTVRVRFLQEKIDNTSAPYRDYTISAGSQLTIRDVIYTQFGVTGKGALELYTRDGAYFTANARSYTNSDKGSFGHEIQAQDWVVYGGQQAFTSGVHLGEGYRTNIGAASVSDSPTTIFAEVFDDSGTLRWSYTFNLRPWSNEQVAVQSNSGDFGKGFVRWTCDSSYADAAWVAYATPADNVSNDAIYYEERLDDQYTTVIPDYDLSGMWYGTMYSYELGSQAIDVDIWQDGATVTGRVYDDYTGFRILYLYGYEDQGSIYFSGTPYVLDYVDEDFWGNAQVNSSTSVSGAFTGTGVYEAGGTFTLTQAYSYSMQRNAKTQAAPAGHRHFAHPRANEPASAAAVGAKH